MNCPHCQGEIQEGALKCKWCKELLPVQGDGPRPQSSRSTHQGSSETRLAVDESARLTYMASIMGIAVAIPPIPGTFLGLTALQVLLMGAISFVWGRPLSGALIATVINGLALQMGLATGLQALADALWYLPVVGWVAKPAIAFGTVQVFGNATTKVFAGLFGAKAPAAMTAEDAKERLVAALGRFKENSKEHAMDLKQGLVELVRTKKGDRLAASLRKLFGLSTADPDTMSSSDSKSEDDQA